MSEKPTKIAVSKTVQEVYIARLRWKVGLYCNNNDNWISVFSDIPPSPEHSKAPFAVLSPAECETL